MLRSCVVFKLSEKVQLKFAKPTFVGQIDSFKQGLLKYNKSSGYGCQITRNSSKAAFCYKIGEPLKIEDVKETKLKKGEVRYLSNSLGLDLF